MDHGRIEDSLFCFGMAIAKDLPDVEYETIDIYDKTKPKTREEYLAIPKVKKIRRPHEWHCEVFSFPQTWGHGSTIFGGMGTAAFTTQQVTVVIHKRSAAVYVGRQLGYVIESFSQTLMDDIKTFHIANCADKDKYNGIKYK